MIDLDIVFPDTNSLLDQNEEYFILKNSKDEKIQFHDYRRIYQTPGLYEKIFYEHLNCNSPKVLSEMLYKNLNERHDKSTDLRILDFGAGNGMVAEELKTENPEFIVGVDIIPEAKEAALRDRSKVYDEYYVADLGQPEEEVLQELESYDLNAMISVAALGFDHIPPKSFVNAFNLIENDGWVAFNLRDRFLTKEDDSGFKHTLDHITDECMELLDERTYVHRLSIHGDPINYTAIVARKLSDIGD